LKQIFLRKEHELGNTLDKIDELTHQLTQLKSCQLNHGNGNDEHDVDEQCHKKNQLDKLRQELLVGDETRELVCRRSFVSFRSATNSTNSRAARSSISVICSPQDKQN
jgi:hypothetical protein